MLQQSTNGFFRQDVAVELNGYVLADEVLNVLVFDCAIRGLSGQNKSDCGRCLRPREASTDVIEFGCGWCSSETRSSSCSRRDDCDDAPSWESDVTKCPRPSIQAVTPLFGQSSKVALLSQCALV